MTSNSAQLKRSRSPAADADDDNTASASAPPLSKRVTRSRSSAADPQASDRIQDAARSSQDDEWSAPYDFEDTILHSSFLAKIKLAHKRLAVPFERILLEMLSFEIKNGTSDQITICVEAIDQWFASYPQTGSTAEQSAFKWIQTEWQVWKNEYYKPVAPSSFGRSAKWVHQQNGVAFINCLRPPERGGLPLSLLHPLFAEFVDLIEGPPPDSSDPHFSLAKRVAIELCQEMPRHFGNENGRLDTFEHIVSGLFGDIGVLGREFRVGSGRADLGLGLPKIGLVLVCEGKKEPGGSSGDPYMQVAASYDAWARGLKDRRRINTGCPCFVCCVDGPNILFGGGFRDNEVSVVEPLSGWCVMMPHVQLKREQILARHLYALFCCLNDPNKFMKPLPSSAACCPRIYDAFIRSDNQESVPLKFDRPFESPWHRRRGVFDLLFSASVEGEMGNDLPTSLLVKVPIGSTYGLKPHVLAASAGFAPRLLGKASVPGAPVIYVMELLSKSEGWFHLVKGERPKRFTEQHRRHLRDRGTELITFLSQNSLVHGDLRRCNVMCHLGDNDVDLRVLDWDWAGTQGTARYPETLNTEVGYQGQPGGLIEASHDEAMFGETLDDFFGS